MFITLAPPSPLPSNSNMAPPLDDRDDYWWRVIGRVVSDLLARSAYPTDIRAGYDHFFRTSIAPLFGPAPHQYPASLSSASFMCDDHTPIEIGWVFKPTGKSVQYAIDALTPIDGTPYSPEQNLDLLSLLAANGQCRDFDMDWTLKCTQSLLTPASMLSPDLKRVSQFFIGVELGRTGMMSLKAYFIPKVRSLVDKVSAMDIITPTVKDLGMEIPWSKATSFFHGLPEKYNVQPVIVAVDCVPGPRNRLKVYVRTQATHLSALCDMLTLGGQLDGLAIDATLAKLRKIWHALFGNVPDDLPVQQKKRSNLDPPTGFLFYYEMSPNNHSPIPKIYIPAARFLKNDEHVAQVMSKFLGDSYHGDVKTLFPHRRLDSGSGIQAHITLAAKNGTCQISSYLNPEAFSQHA